MHGLELVAVPVVLLAVLAMPRTLAPDLPRLDARGRRRGARAGRRRVRRAGRRDRGSAQPSGSSRSLRSGAAPALHVRAPGGRGLLAVACLAALAALLVGLPAVADATGRHAVALVDAMVRSGSLVFGGGHVVLPLLDEASSSPGGSARRSSSPATGSSRRCRGRCSRSPPIWARSRSPSRTASPAPALALVAIYLPSFLLLAAVLPLWSYIRRHRARPGRAGGRLRRSRRASRRRVVGSGADDVGRRRRRRRVRGRAPRHCSGCCPSGRSFRSQRRPGWSSSELRRHADDGPGAREPLRELLGGHRMAEVEALREIAAEVADRLPGEAALDALGDGLEAEPVRQLDERRGRSRPARPPRPASCRNIASIFTWSSGSMRIAATDDARPRSSSDSRTPRSCSRFTTKRSSSEPAPGPKGRLRASAAAARSASARAAPPARRRARRRRACDTGR